MNSIHPNNSTSQTAQENPVSPYVIGIGASAGGLEALERLFDRMPADSGMAFVVVQHLSPDFKSLMNELLARWTKMEIHRVEHETPVEANHIYLMPPKKEMIISDGVLYLKDKDDSHGLTLPIDQFFRSLAQDQKTRAVGVILSGTGTDGSRGIREIHETGGFVVVQDPETAKFDGMPKSAIETGVVDCCLAPEKMPDALIRRATGGKDAGDVVDSSESIPPHGMQAVFKLLRDEYGIDFVHYKPATVARRTQRRVQISQSTDLEDYLAKLRNDPEELNALYRDLLIGVTQFFRDKQAFKRLESDVLPELLEKIASDNELRIWVAGCATGEEAYSLAILVQEQMEKLQRPLDVKIFATDVHRASLDVASRGVYSRENLEGVSSQRLERFFVPYGNDYQVVPDLRRMIVFAQHNLIKDAPFTKIDLATCRNLLIYLQTSVQKKVLSLFHFALKMSGILFLGPSESPGELSDEFESLDQHWKLYRKSRDVRIPPDLRAVTETPFSTGSIVSPPPASPGWGDQHLAPVFGSLLEDALPPSVLIDEHRRVVHAFGDSSRFLHFRPGRVSLDVLSLVDGDLRVALAGALQRVAREHGPVSFTGIRLSDGSEETRMKLSLRPVPSPNSDGSFMLITLERMDEPRPAPDDDRYDVDQVTRDRVDNLESELRYTKENLQATIEEVETSNEELQATNEELVASNEELQSTNEELHSVNEELYTVNAEYQKKIEELSQMTAEMDALFASTTVHTIFLNNDLCIRKFTPGIADTFNLLPQDLGRRIDAFSHHIDDANLITDITRVRDTHEVVEREVRDHNGNWYLLRIRPFQREAVVEGVVVTLIDVTNLKNIQAQARSGDRLLREIANNSSTLIFVKDLEDRYLLVNQAFADVAGKPIDEIVGRSTHEVFPADLADTLLANDVRVIKKNHRVGFEETIANGDSTDTYLSVAFPLRDDDGALVGVGGIKTKVTRLKRAEEESRNTVKQRDEFLAVLSHELRNPLGAVINAARVAEENEGEAPRAVEVVGRQAEHMARLLDDLLDVARIHQNKIELHKKVVDLRSIVDDAVMQVEPLIKEHDLRFTVDVCEESLPVYGDAVRLTQVVANLLTNAAKYTPDGGAVELEIAEENGGAVVRVSDTGIGIDQQHLDEIFRLFVQGADHLERHNGGMGVGLTLVRLVVEMHGGTVTARSQGPGKGAEFRVEIPITSKTLDSSEKSVNVAAPTIPRTIVLVEDNEDSREMLVELLKFYGHQVWAAADGLSGVEKILEVKPDVALVDIGLPVLDGYEVARRVRERLGGEIRLVALTGYGQPNDREQAKQAGFDDHLTKPIKHEALDALLAGQPQSALEGEKTASSS